MKVSYFIYFYSTLLIVPKVLNSRKRRICIIYVLLCITIVYVLLYVESAMVVHPQGLCGGRNRFIEPSIFCTWPLCFERISVTALLRH